MSVVESVKKGFFDRSAVMNSVDRARLKGLSKFGAFVRTTARSSMRKRRKVSLPGQPPSVHEGSVKRLLYFSYDSNSRSTVVGPVMFQGKGRRIQPVGQTVPQTLEDGGTIRVQEVQLSGGLWVGASEKLLAASRARRTRIATIKPRPFMKPALAKVAPKFPEFFKDTVK